MIVINPLAARLFNFLLASLIVANGGLYPNLFFHVLNSGNCMSLFQLASGRGHRPIDILKYA